MDKLPAGSQIAMSMVQGCLVVPVQTDLYDDLLERTRRSILNRVNSKTVSGVIFDMSSVRVMDSYVFNHLVETAMMALLLGVPAAFIGFQAGTVSALVDLEVDTTAVRSYRTMEEAVQDLTAQMAVAGDDGQDAPLRQADRAWKRALDGYEPEK